MTTGCGRRSHQLPGPRRRRRRLDPARPRRALLLTRLQLGARNLIYAVLVAPVLMPGIVIGLSTAIFWDRTAEIADRGGSPAWQSERHQRLIAC